MLIRFCCLVFFVCLGCTREDSSLAQEKDEIPAIVEVWSTPEEASCSRLLIIYSNFEFKLWESSDVGGLTKSNGVYEWDESELIIVFKGKGLQERFWIFRENGKIQRLQSQLASKYFMYRCEGVGHPDDWPPYIQNDIDFKNRVNDHKCERPN